MVRKFSHGLCFGERALHFDIAAHFQSPAQVQSIVRALPARHVHINADYGNRISSIFPSYSGTP
jgi:hypothetical protein